MQDFIKDLESSLQRGFIDQTHPNKGDHQPQLLLNSKQAKQEVLSSLTEELDHCYSFLFSVAFITEQGLATLKSHLLDLKLKGISGRLLTSTFLTFNQPAVFRELLKMTNLDVRVTDVQGFHAKGYIFEQPTHYTLIVGSSNLTASALQVNHEWNVKLTSHENGEIIHHFYNQFEEMWQTATSVTESWIEEYAKVYEQAKSLPEQVAELPTSYETNPWQQAVTIEPNTMQQNAMQQLETVRAEGNDKALIISATGTGKTYLAAFDVRRYTPKRMLFIAHREQILKKAKADFQRVLGGPDYDYGLLSGSHRDLEAKYVFATIQTLSREEQLQNFSREDFDYILIDEVHKAGALSYQRVMDYFTPDFFMGMTATPERTDDVNIYELFDYTIAYEIRLQEALEEDMLCSFQYFGVTEFEQNGRLIDDTTTLTDLVTEERVGHLIDKIHYYGWSGDYVRGLIFCSQKEEAHHLSAAMNKQGYRTVALTGDDSQEERLRRIDELENGDLEYILTVDIFNEGVDIPSINQVVMLRQTESSIIFIQQLGRGLRKHDSKDFLTVIDFIGNYKKNYLIPIALSGDKSQNKDNIRRRMKDTSYIHGVSSIHFEEVAKKKIFESINSENLMQMSILKDAYQELKNRLGRIPYLTDFQNHHSIDPEVLVGKAHNYHSFLLKMKEDIQLYTKHEDQVLTMFSQDILPGKRKHEVILLDMLLRDGVVTQSAFIDDLMKVGCRTDEATLTSVERIFNLEFFTVQDQKKYGEQPIVVKENGTYRWTTEVKRQLEQNENFRAFVQDIVTVGSQKMQHYSCVEPFQLHEKYSRKDTMKLLNWENDEKATVFGYKVKYNTCPIFITYKKESDVENSVNYRDEFINKNMFSWYSKSRRTLNSKDVQQILNADRNQISLYIFIKKDDGEGNHFYYLGQASPDKFSAEETEMVDEDKKLPVVRMDLHLERSVDKKLYRYLID
ncbi:DUF3427 domain-containing protein [Salibacterium halotolerans]|uniref:Superfamily II DNA or RNA helicase n=1 Tax=Salibacterium halotolerans TaxID=1884432 RepID=A0A1I5SFE8_9BACI|nr:DEAD/DEAH box helicase [Salibacterium halotolerans]SFP69470.1 Superfamily II DNA or RNA helicase [Salibacterium halotolerans]